MIFNFCHVSGQAVGTREREGERSKDRESRTNGTFFTVLKQQGGGWGVPRGS